MQIPQYQWQQSQSSNVVPQPPGFGHQVQNASMAPLPPRLTTAPQSLVPPATGTTANGKTSGKPPEVGNAAVSSQMGTATTGVTSSILAPIASTFQQMLGANKTVSPPGAAVRQNMKKD